MKKLLPIFLLVFLFGCDSTLKFEKRSFEDLYSLDVESSMSELDDMDPYANVEYGNEFKEFYFKVIHSSVQDFKDATYMHHLEDDEVMAFYLQDVEEDIKTFMSKPTLIGREARNINNLPCVLFEVKTDGNGHAIRYYIAHYMSKKRFYELHVWTMETRLERLQEGINQMINSFQEI